MTMASRKSMSTAFNPGTHTQRGRFLRLCLSERAGRPGWDCSSSILLETRNLASVRGLGPREIAGMATDRGTTGSLVALPTECACVCVCVYICVCVCVCMCVCMCAYVYMWVRICVCVCVCVHVSERACCHLLTLDSVKARPGGSEEVLVVRGVNRALCNQKSLDCKSHGQGVRVRVPPRGIPTVRAGLLLRTHGGHVLFERFQDSNGSCPGPKDAAQTWAQRCSQRYSGYLSTTSLRAQSVVQACLPYLDCR
jgi:hypothetical protein